MIPEYVVRLSMYKLAIDVTVLFPMYSLINDMILFCLNENLHPPPKKKNTKQKPENKLFCNSVRMNKVMIYFPKAEIGIYTKVTCVLV